MKKLWDDLFLLFRENFQVMLVAGLFTLVFLTYVGTMDPDRAAAMRELWQGLLYAFLALLGLRPKGTAVGSASTTTGDVVVQQQPPPADPAKEKLRNEDI